LTPSLSSIISPGNLQKKLWKYDPHKKVGFLISDKVSGAKKSFWEPQKSKKIIFSTSKLGGW